MISELDHVTRTDIIKALRSGTVPTSGLEHFAVGLDEQIDAIREQFAYVAAGKSAYRFLRGAYGSGKTFLSTLVASIALRQDFLTSSVVVSVSDTPLFKLAQVYRRVCGNLSSRSHQGGALRSLVDRWLHQLEDTVIEIDGIDENTPHFSSAVAARVEQSLAGVGEKAGRMVACLRAYHRCQVDAIDKNEFPGLLLLVTGTPDFFDSPRGVAGVEALHQRLHVEFREDRPDNFRMPQIRLREFDRSRLLEVARKVKEIYLATHPDRIARRVDDTLLRQMIATVTEGFGGHVDIVPRLFLREFIQVLDLVDLHDHDPRTQYSFNADRVADGLTEEEKDRLSGGARTIYL